MKVTEFDIQISVENVCKMLDADKSEELYEEIKDTYETYVIGDAREVAQALEAVRAAYELGYQL